MRQAISLTSVQQGYKAVIDLWASVIKPALIDGKRLHLEVRSETRSLEQNSLMWSCLTDLSRQVEWPVNGRLEKLSPDEWKTILSAGLTKAQRVAAGVEGGFVMLGSSTSRMTIGEMSDLVTLAHAFGDERSVRWSKTSLGRDWPEECAERSGVTA